MRESVVRLTASAVPSVVPSGTNLMSVRGILRIRRLLIVRRMVCMHIRLVAIQTGLLMYIHRLLLIVLLLCLRLLLVLLL